MKMSFGNEIGFAAREDAQNLWFGARPGAILAECDGEVEGGLLLGYTTQEPVIRLGGEEVPVAELLSISEGVLEEVYPHRRHRRGGAHLLHRARSNRGQAQGGHAQGGHPCVPRHQL